MAATYVLLQFGDDSFSHRFEDLESRPAFTVKTAHELPTIVVQVAREPEWSQQHPDIMGPDNAYLYFGPNKSRGFLVYGNGKEVPMANQIRQKKDSSTERGKELKMSIGLASRVKANSVLTLVDRSRYFTTQHGKELKWKIFPQKMECVDGRTTVATWELSQPEDLFNARLTIRHAGLCVVTEILTTLTLNRMAMALKWQT